MTDDTTTDSTETTTSELDTSTPDRPVPRARTRRPAAAPGPAAPRWPTVARTAIVTLLTVAAVAASFLAFRFHGRVQDLERADADRARAEQIAGDYGVAAATLDYQDLAPWLASLRKGVGDDLAKRYDGVAETLRQVLVPLQLVSKGTLVTSTVRSEARGVYQVVAVVDVSATSVQAPQGTVTTSAYTMAVDRNQDWRITTVGDPASNTSLPLAGITPTAPAPDRGAATAAPGGGAAPAAPAPRP